MRQINPRDVTRLVAVAIPSLAGATLAIGVLEGYVGVPTPGRRPRPPASISSPRIPFDMRQDHGPITHAEHLHAMTRLIGTSAREFKDRLDQLRTPDEQRRNERNLKTDDTDLFIGVRMGQIFGLARELMDMDPAEIEALLESPIHEVRVGAVSVMDWQARSRATTADRRRELFGLYLRRHDRINAWDLVDRSAIWVVGEYLRDKPREVLYRLARSANPWERRTAIVSTAAFIRRGDLDDTFGIADLLRDEPHDLVRKPVGWMLREAGKVDEPRLRSFLDAHVASMPRVMLRYAIEKLDPDVRKGYLLTR